MYQACDAFCSILQYLIIFLVMMQVTYHMRLWCLSNGQIKVGVCVFTSASVAGHHSLVVVIYYRLYIV